MQDAQLSIYKIRKEQYLENKIAEKERHTSMRFVFVLLKK